MMALPILLGYKLITTGKVRITDKVWNIYDEKWEANNAENFDLLGNQVSNYYFVMRKNK